MKLISFSLPTLATSITTKSQHTLSANAQTMLRANSIPLNKQPTALIGNHFSTLVQPMGRKHSSRPSPITLDLEKFLKGKDQRIATASPQTWHAVNRDELRETHKRLEQFLEEPHQVLPLREGESYVVHKPFSRKATTDTIIRELQNTLGEKFVAEHEDDIVQKLNGDSTGKGEACFASTIHDLSQKFVDLNNPQFRDETKEKLTLDIKNILEDRIMAKPKNECVLSIEHENSHQDTVVITTPITPFNKNRVQLPNSREAIEEFKRLIEKHL